MVKKVILIVDDNEEVNMNRSLVNDKLSYFKLTDLYKCFTKGRNQTIIKTNIDDKHNINIIEYFSD